MEALSQKILNHLCTSPEGGVLSAKELLHLGARAAVDQALSRMARDGHLERACRGVYFRPIKSRFGSRSPAAFELARGIGTRMGETVVPQGAVAANALGLTTQVPVREVFWTSGPNRELKLGAQKVEFRHVPRWQLILPGQPAGDAIRALAWAGPKHAEKTVRALGAKLSPSERDALIASRGALPSWLAQAVGTLISHA